MDSYGDNIASVTKEGSGGTEIFNSYGSFVGGVPVSASDAITSDAAGVAASVITEVTEITTDGDSNLDNVTLANGIDGQTKRFVVVAVGNVADSVKVTPASMIGGTQVTFAANPIGKSCTMSYSVTAGGWSCESTQGGTVA